MKNEFPVLTTVGRNVYKSTTAKGITREIEIPVPWGIISGKIYGNSSNPPVLCIHGWLDNCNVFDPLIPLLPRDRFYVFIDLPGHGRSSAIPVGFFYSLLLAVSVIERIRLYFQWKIFSFISHSMGGHYSGIYAGTFPEKIDKLILLDSLGVYLTDKDEDTRFMKDSLEKGIQFEKKFAAKSQPSYKYEVAKAKLLKSNSSLNESIAEILLERGSKRLEDGTYVYLRDIRQTPKEPSAMNDEVSVKFMKDIRAETMHLISDMWLPKYVRESNKEFSINAFSYFKSCEFHERVNVGGNHYVHMHQPEKIMGHVRNLLNRPPRPGLLKQKTVISSNL